MDGQLVHDAVLRRVQSRQHVFLGHRDRHRLKRAHVQSQQDHALALRQRTIVNLKVSVFADAGFDALEISQPVLRGFQVGSDFMGDGTARHARAFGVGQFWQAQADVDQGNAPATGAQPPQQRAGGSADALQHHQRQRREHVKENAHGHIVGRDYGAAILRQVAP